MIFSSTVVANILPVAASASAFAIESGNLVLSDELDQDIAVKTLTIEDYGVFDHGLGGRVFDDEGTPTQTNESIKREVRCYVAQQHNWEKVRKEEHW